MSLQNLLKHGLETNWGVTKIYKYTIQEKAVLCFLGLCDFSLVWFYCCLVLFGIFSFLCVCVYVCVSFFSSSKRKGRKISQLVKIIAWNEEHGIQLNFILTQRHQHLENNFSIRDISSQTFITLNGKGKILNCYKASVQLKWWEKDL